MLQVNFYILPDADESARLLFVCRLIDKIYHQGHGIYVQAQAQTQAQALDDLLWRFKPESFLPHALATEQSSSPIEIGYTTILPAAKEVLINLTLDIPSFHTQFQRLVEVLNQEPTILQTGRKHYKDYQQQGYQLALHDLRKPS